LVCVCVCVSVCVFHLAVAAILANVFCFVFSPRVHHRGVVGFARVAVLPHPRIARQVHVVSVLDLERKVEVEEPSHAHVPVVDLF